LAGPGGNLTGVTLTPGPEFGAKRLQLLQELAPSITRTTFLATRDVLEQHRSAMRPVVVPVLVDAAEQYDEAFATILRERADAPMAARPQRVLVKESANSAKADKTFGNHQRR